MWIMELHNYSYIFYNNLLPFDWQDGCCLTIWQLPHRGYITLCVDIAIRKTVQATTSEEFVLQSNTMTRYARAKDCHFSLPVSNTNIWNLPLGQIVFYQILSSLIFSWSLFCSLYSLFRKIPSAFNEVMQPVTQGYVVLIRIT